MISCTLTDGVQIATVQASRIDAEVAIEFKDKMRDETSDGPERIILDLSQVEFVDSSGLGAIVAAMKQLGVGRKLDLCGLTQSVDNVFRLTRMDTVFRLYPSIDTALAAPAA